MYVASYFNLCYHFRYRNKLKLLYFSAMSIIVVVVVIVALLVALIVAIAVWRVRKKRDRMDIKGLFLNFPSWIPSTLTRLFSINTLEPTHSSEMLGYIS